MKQWFNGCETVEELKKRYHELAREYHPDNGGNQETMKDINAEFDRLHKILKDTHKRTDGSKWTAEKGTEKENKEAPEEFRAMVNELIHYNVLIEFIGCYIWVSGETMPAKERLKSYGFRWSQNKKAWYLKPENYKPMSRRNWTMDEIRSYHGVQASYQGTRENQREYERIQA